MTLFRRLGSRRTAQRRTPSTSKTATTEKTAPTAGGTTTRTMTSTATAATTGNIRVRRTPILSGVMAPLAIVLEVPGVTSKWYAHIDSDGLVTRFVDNPTILTVGLAISLAAAVAANAAIILRFLEVLPPRASLLIAIVAFALHDLINLVSLATFGAIYGPRNDGLSLSASYWMVCASTLASLLVTVSLIVDYARTNDYRHAGSGLTQRQKGLVLAVMALLLYLSLGSLVFTFLVGIDFITALYFSTATILTVGFGDVIPESVAAKVVVVLYAPGGIVLVALVVSSAKDTLLESFQASFRARLARRRQRVLLKRAERRQNQAATKGLRQLVYELKTGRTMVAAAAPALETSLVVQTTADTDQADAEFADSADPHGRQRAMTLDTLAKDEQAQEARAEDASSDQLLVVSAACAAAASLSADILDEIKQMQQQLHKQRQELEAEFRAYEERNRRQARIEAATKMGLAFSMFLTFWLVGALAFKYTERWSYFHAFWFCFIAMITIGYGDLSPKTQIGRGVFVVWGLIGVAVLTILLAVVQDACGNLLQGALDKSTARLFDRKSAKCLKRSDNEREGEGEGEDEDEGEGEGEGDGDTEGRGKPQDDRDEDERRFRESLEQWTKQRSAAWSEKSEADRKAEEVERGDERKNTGTRPFLPPLPSHGHGHHRHWNGSTGGGKTSNDGCCSPPPLPPPPPEPPGGAGTETEMFQLSLQVARAAMDVWFQGQQVLSIQRGSEGEMERVEAQRRLQGACLVPFSSRLSEIDTDALLFPFLFFIFYFYFLFFMGWDGVDWASRGRGWVVELSCCPGTEFGRGGRRCSVSDGELRAEARRGRCLSSFLGYGAIILCRTL
ncbi:Potassium channel [Thecaphora frezii]